MLTTNQPGGPLKATQITRQRKAKLEAALPAYIAVLGKTFNVKVCNLKGASGDTCMQTFEIRIHQNQSLEDALATLWHEALHAALGVAGLNEILLDSRGDYKLEEAIVRCLEHAFSDIVDITKLGVTKPSKLK